MSASIGTGPIKRSRTLPAISRKPLNECIWQKHHKLCDTTLDPYTLLQYDYTLHQDTLTQCDSTSHIYTLPNSAYMNSKIQDFQAKYWIFFKTSIFLRPIIIVYSEITLPTPQYKKPLMRSLPPVWFTSFHNRNCTPF